MGLFDTVGLKQSESTIPTAEKALHINRDRSKYGTFAEIGAGQEVVRWFFLVGGASGTVAKSMSAYDMTVSDAIYGKSPRYVSRVRLLQMLDHEYALNVERLTPKLESKGHIFAFADTVATKSSRGPSLGHGWMGIRFQATPGSAPSQILIHVNMLDKDVNEQQEALGVVGVNLIYGAFHEEDPVKLMAGLLDNLTRSRIEVDMIEFTGERYQGFDNRIAALGLLTLNLSDAAMLGPSGEVLQPSDLLFRRPVLIERGKFDPVTLTHLDILRCGESSYFPTVQGAEHEPVVLMEMSTHNLIRSGEVDAADFLARVEVLNAIGKTVLVTDFPEYYGLAEYIRRYTQEHCAMALSVNHLRELFEEKYYENLDGGILEGLGLLFKRNFTFYIYPIRSGSEIITAEKFEPTAPLDDIYRYLRRRGYIIDMPSYDPECLSIYASDVARLIQDKNPIWKTMVPPAVIDLIEERRFFSNDTGPR